MDRSMPPAPPPFPLPLDHDALDELEGAKSEPAPSNVMPFEKGARRAPASTHGLPLSCGCPVHAASGGSLPSPADLARQAFELEARDLWKDALLAAIRSGKCTADAKESADVARFVFLATFKPIEHGGLGILHLPPKRF